MSSTQTDNRSSSFSIIEDLDGFTFVAAIAITAEWQDSTSLFIFCNCTYVIDTDMLNSREISVAVTPYSIQFKTFILNYKVNDLRSTVNLDMLSAYIFLSVDCEKPVPSQAETDSTIYLYVLSQKISSTSPLL